MSEQGKNGLTYSDAGVDIDAGARNFSCAWRFLTPN